MERLAAVEADLRVAASDREQALQKHRNLEAVVRRFQAVADEDKAKAKKVHLDRVYELETELEHARAANEDLVKENGDMPGQPGRPESNMVERRSGELPKCSGACSTVQTF